MNDRLEMENKERSKDLSIRQHSRFSTQSSEKCPENTAIAENVTNYLQQHVAKLQAENKMLHEKLSEINLNFEKTFMEKQKLSTKIKMYEGFNGYTSAPQVANLKIVELSKKIREKNSEMEIYKTKCLKLETLISQQTNKDHDEKPKNIPFDESQAIIRGLETKVKYITNKWSEEKNLVLQLKNDLKRANKWLQQEVGDKFETLLNLNNSNCTWRGRAQIICDLQQKNAELKEQLQRNINGLQKKDPRSTYYEEKFETLSQESINVRKDHEYLKRKFETLKVRCQNIRVENDILKTKNLSLLQRVEESQQTIDKLTSQVSCLKEQKTDDLKERDEIIKKLEQESEMLKIEIMKLHCKFENQSKELLNKSNNIQILNQKIKSSRPSSSYVYKHNKSDTTWNKLEVERQRLLELSETQIQRLENERNAHMKTQQILRVERQRGAKLEAKVARLELDLRDNQPSYRSRIVTPTQSNTDLTDELQLAEDNIKALTTRLEVEILERKNDFEKFTNILKH